MAWAWRRRLFCLVACYSCLASAHWQDPGGEYCRGLPGGGAYCLKQRPVCCGSFCAGPGSTCCGESYCPPGYTCCPGHGKEEGVRCCNPGYHCCTTQAAGLRCCPDDGGDGALVPVYNKSCGAGRGPSGGAPPGASSAGGEEQHVCQAAGTGLLGGWNEFSNCCGDKWCCARTAQCCHGPSNLEFQNGVVCCPLVGTHCCDTGCCLDGPNVTDHQDGTPSVYYAPMLFMPTNIAGGIATLACLVLLFAWYAVDKFWYSFSSRLFSSDE